MVGGQIEFTDSSWNRRTLLDRHQPFVVAKMLTHLSGLCQKAAVDAIDLAQEGVERLGLDRGIVLEGSEQLPLSLELLQDVGLQIRACRDVGDLEERE